MENWQLFRDPRFALQFKYPILATDREPVDKLETQQAGLPRVHILSPESREVCFEVSKNDLLTAPSEYQQHKEYLQKRFHPIAIAELSETSCASLPASEYAIEGDQGLRIVILVQRADGLYRILYDPQFSVNVQILSTMEWLFLP